MPVSPILSVTLVYCDQTVGWIKMKLGTEVGLGPGHIVLNTNPAISPQTRHRRLLSAKTPGTSANDRNTTSGSTGSQYSTSQVTGSTFLPSRDFRIIDLRIHTAVFAISVKPEVGWLSTGSSFATVVPCGNLHQSFTDAPVMVALWNKADHYIFALWFLLSSFFLLFPFLA